MSSQKKYKILHLNLFFEILLFHYVTHFIFILLVYTFSFGYTTLWISNFKFFDFYLFLFNLYELKSSFIQKKFKTCKLLPPHIL